ncbi:hypothetical protein VTN49DRAFT_2512 [Thermomyces lanuginosus]|uniref:uncharacterized protein n=1 Tax=Thermomyces lanuginosus TaxID=5541 RepID=UPI0037429532
MLPRTLLSIFLIAAPVGAKSCAWELLESLSLRWNNLAGSHLTQEICSAGCEPRIATWDTWAHDHAFLPLVDILAEEMEISPIFKDNFVRIVRSIVDATKRECTDAIFLTDNQHLCMGNDQLSQWNRCVKTQAVKVAMKNILSILRLVSKEICGGSSTPSGQSRVEYLLSPRVWEDLLPRYMRLYASTCETSRSLRDEQERQDEGLGGAKDEL